MTTNSAAAAKAVPAAPRLAEPYVGPRPFEEDDAPFFFGRDGEAYELKCRIVANAELLLYAQSGAGKTSLINARLLPLLRREGCELLPLARVRQQVPGIRANTVSNLYVFHTLVSWAPQADPQALVDQTLDGFLAAGKRPVDGEDAEDGFPSPRVAIFDQFEELFTAYPDRWKERKGFFEQVRRALKADPDLRVVFSMREDHIAALDPYVRLLPEKLRIRFRLERLRREAALSAVKKPLERLTHVHRKFADGVAEQLVDNLLQVQVRAETGVATAAVGEYVEAVQLQVACQTLWQNLPAEVTEITQAELQSFGDVNQALARYYERAVQTTVREKGVREGKLRRWFSEVLITPAGTRGLVYRGEFDAAGIPNEVADDLEGVHHLLRGEERAGAHWYELSHDRFIRPIREANQKWFDQRSTVRKALLALEARARDFQAAGGLLSTEELPEAERWASSPEAAEVGYDDSLVLPLLRASRMAVDRARLDRELELERATERARTRELELEQTRARARIGDLRRRATVALAIAILLLGGAAIWAFSLRAEKEKADAVAAAREEDGLEQSRRRERYKLELERHQVLTRDVKNLTADLEPLQSDALKRIARILRAEQAVCQVREKAPGETDWTDETVTWLATRLKERTVEAGSQIEKALRDAILAARRHMVVFGCASRARQVELSSDGRWLITAGDDRKVSVWDVRTGAASPAANNIPVADKTDLYLRGPLREIAVSGGDRPIAVLLVADAEVAGAAGTPAATGAGPGGQFIPGGRRDQGVAASHVEIWDARTGTKLEIPDFDKTKGARCVGVSADGRRVFVGRERDVYVFAPDKPDEVQTLSQTAAVDMVYPSLDGRQVVVVLAQIALPVRWDVPSQTKRELKGISSRIANVVISRDGTLVAAAGENGSAVVWQAESGRLLNAITRSYGAIEGIAFSPDGARLAVTAVDGTVSVYSAASGSSSAEQILRGDSVAVNCIAFSRDGTLLATGGFDRAARLWDAKSGKLIGECLGHTGSVLGVRFSPDDRWLVTSSEDRTVRLWDAHARPEAASFVPLHAAQKATGGAYSPKGTFLVALGEDGNAHVFGAKTRAPITTLTGHRGPITAAAFDQGETMLATAGSDGRARVWRTTDWGLVADLPHPAPLRGVAFSPVKADSLLTVSEDDTVNLWSVAEKDRTPLLERHTARLLGAAFSPDGGFILAADTDNSSFLWQTDNCESSKRLTGSADHVSSQSFAVTGERVLAVTASRGRWRSQGDGFGQIWDSATGRPGPQLRDPGGPIASVAHHPDGSLVATGGADGRILLWDAQTGKRVGELTGHRGPVSVLVFSSTGNRLASEAMDERAKVWDVAARKEIATLHGLTGVRPALAFSPDGARVVAEGGPQEARIWDATSGQVLHVLRGHAGPISGVAFSPDGKTVVTASWDKTARIWEAATGTCTAVLNGHDGRLNAVGFSPDGAHVVTAGEDGVARVWDPRDGKSVTTLWAPSARVTRVGFSPKDGREVVAVDEEGLPRRWDASSGRALLADPALARNAPWRPKPTADGPRPVGLDGIRVLASNGNRAVVLEPTGATWVWDVRKRTRIMELEGLVGWDRVAHLSPNDHMVLTRSQTGRAAAVWNIETGKKLDGWPRTLGDFRAAAFSQDSKLVATADDATVRVWDLKFQSRYEWNIPRGGQYQLAFSPDDKYLLAAGSDGTVRVARLEAGSQWVEIKSHAVALRDAALSPDGALLVTAGIDRTVRVWDCNTRAVVTELKGSEGDVRGVAFSPDGERLVAAGMDDTIRVWHRDGPRYVERLRIQGGHSGPVNRAAFSRDGRTVVTAGADGTAVVWDTATARALTTLRGHFRAVKEVRFSADGAHLVTVGGDDRVLVWNWKSGTPVGEPIGGRFMQTVASATFSPDGRLVATASSDGRGRLWDAATGQLLTELTEHTKEVTRAYFSPDGGLLVTTSFDGTARLWEPTTGMCLQVLRDPDQKEVHHADFSPDGSYVATASSDNAARIWDVRTAAVVKLGNHEGAVKQVRFSPDGRRVATASADKTARLWDARTGECLHNFRHSGSLENGIAFSPDGKLLATAAYQGDFRVQVWNTDTGQQVCNLEHPSGVTGIVFSPDGKSLIAACLAGACVWDIGAGRLIRTMEHSLSATGSPASVLRVAYSPDGTYVATIGSDRMACLWEASTGRMVVRLAGYADAVDSPTFSRNGRFLATTSPDGTARVWEVPSGRSLVKLDTRIANLNDASLSPDGKSLVTVSGNLVGTREGAARFARVWDAAKGDRIDSGRFTYGLGNIQSAAFSPPDGKHLVTLDGSATPVLWEVKSGDRKPLRGHTDVVNRAAFDAGGKFLLTLSKDGTARIWDVGERAVGERNPAVDNAWGKPIDLVFLPGGEKITFALFSPDGTSILVIGERLTAQVYLSDYCGIREALVAKARDLLRLQGPAEEAPGRRSKEKGLRDQ